MHYPTPRFCLWLLVLSALLLGQRSAQAQVLHRVNFSDVGTAPPSGYLRDSGDPFGLRPSGETYGWLTTDGLTGLDLTANGRNRARTGISLLQNTIMHMQYGDTGGSNGNSTEGIWEIAVPNGDYEVTVEVGDQPGYDSQHSLNVEGVPAITLFQGSTSQEYVSATVVVTVSDGRLTIDAAGGTNTKITSAVVETFVVAPPSDCPPISSLACSQVSVGLPFSLTFDGSEGGLSQTGFTMVDPPSARLTDDGPVSDSAVPGYEPSRLTVAGGNLSIDAAKGIAFLKPSGSGPTSTETNSQLNTLGVAFDASGSFDLSTTLVNPYQDGSNNSEQAGLWFGLDEDNFVKLVATNNSNIELRVEVGSNSANSDQVLLSVPGLGSSTVNLRLLVNQDSGRFEAFYTVDGGTEQALGTLPLPTSFINGATVDGQAVSYGGIFASKRREAASTSVVYTFEDFSLTPAVAPPPPPPPPSFSAIQVNFSDPATTAPAGWVRDSGDPFGLRANGETYGWLTTDGLTALDLTANGRNRERPAIDLLLNTLIHLQYGDVSGSNGNPTEGIWEIEVPNGNYEVSVSVGDQPGSGGIYDSQHSINVEGVPAISLFQGTAAQEYTSATVTVTVSDGRLTLDAFGGTNTKLNTVVIDTAGATPPPPATFRRFVTFSDSLTTPPVGWLRDFGQPFGAKDSNSYGWIDPATGAPADLREFGRNREPTPDADPLRETLMHMRYSDVPNNSGAQDGDWELAVPNGTYQVLAQIGGVNLESQGSTVHALRAEGQPMLSFAMPDGRVGVRNAVTTVTVTDGNLTLDAVGGTNTKIQLVAVEEASGIRTPAVLGSLPADGDTAVVLNPTISANFLHLPNAGPTGATSLNNNTITSSTVQLYQLSGGPTSGNASLVSATVNGTGGGDAINLTPAANLQANSWYRLVIDGVTDLAGEELLPYSMVFQTGTEADSGSNPGNPGGGFNNDLSQVAFNDAGAVATGSRYTTLTIGPDDKLYGLTIGGDIHRWDMNADGTLANQEVLTGWKSSYGTRTTIGLVFDPSATAGNLIAYVSHCSSGLNGAPAWDGRLSRLSGADLENEQLLLTNLPRSIRDHLTNGIVFDPSDPDVLYFLQGSNSAGGAPDGAWGNRPERLLSAACLRLDLSLLPTSLPLDVQTSMNQAVINAADVNSPTMSDGSYNPYYVNAPLTLYATGIRNAYDLVWHSNGQLYVPTNGTAGGSNSPASVNGTRRPDGTFYDSSLPQFDVVPAIGPNQTQRDWLFRIDPSNPLGYYGHPNPLRGEYVLNRGNVDEGDYPVALQPDPNYRGAAFDFAFNISPNGVIEYRSNAHGGNLQGALLVCRYSGGSDLIVLLPDSSNGDIGTSSIGLPGLSGFNDPLDLVEDLNTGNLYVSDYANSEIVLLRPTVPAADQPGMALSPESWLIDEEVGSTSASFPVTLTNDGTATLTGVTLAAGGDFSVTPSSVASLGVGQSITLNVTFAPTTAGPQTASLTATSSDPSVDPASISLSGLGKSGEPSLQWVLDAHLGQGVIDVGDDDPSTNVINSDPALQGAPSLGDEVAAQLFEQVDPTNPVSLEVLSVYGPTASDPIVAFGWYEAGNPAASQELFTVDNSSASNGQTLNVPINGSTTFNANTPTFGFFNRWPFFGNRVLYSEDSLNTFTGAIPHHIRVYALPGETNAYVIATEEHISGFDYQDIVVIARNVRPAGDTTGSPSEDCPTVDFLAETILPFETNQDAGTATVLDGGETLLVEDNAWKYIPFPYTITPNTVLRFEFQSTEQGEEHAIGFDDDNSVNGDDRRFKLYGTQNTTGDAIQAFNTYPGSGQYESYVIPVGQYFTGTISQLYFTADNDAAPTVGNSFFRNVQVFEDADGDGVCDGDTTGTPVDSLPPGTLRLEGLTQIPGTGQGFPANDRLVFSRIDDNVRNGETYAFDDTETLRIHNEDTTVLTITGLAISDATEFTLPNGEGATLPLEIQPGTFYDLDIQFIESTGGKGPRIRSLTITSNAGTDVVTLAGGYQTAPEGSNELTAQEILDVFGFGTIIPSSIPGEYPTEAELASGSLGDIVVSDFWQQADSSQPVEAFLLYTQRDIGISTVAFLDSSDAVQDGFSFSHAGNINGENQANMLYPKLNTDGTGLAVQSQVSVADSFKIQVATRNTGGNGPIVAATGKPRYLGVKLFRVRDAQGNEIPGEYLALQDFTPGNHDFNDAVVFLRNIEPATVRAPQDSTPQDTTPGDSTITPPDSSADPVVLYRVNTGGVELASIDDGPLWEADTRWEPVSYLISDPAGHRAFVTAATGTTPEVDLSSTPLEVFDRERWDRNGGDNITYSFPVPAPGDYGVRIYLSESDPSMGVGNRVFSIALEGSVPPQMADIDLFAEYGPQIGGVKTHTVTVTDGSLEIEFLRNLGNPLVNGIEIIENPGDGTPPAGQPGLVLDLSELRFEAATGTPGMTATVEVSNNGTADLPDVSLSFTGADAGDFSVTPSSIDTLRAGQMVPVTVTFAPTSEGIKAATLLADAPDPGISGQSVLLTGLGHDGEPSLQRLLDFLLGTGSVATGDDDASTREIHSDPITQIQPLLGDEVVAQVFAPASAAPVEVELLAFYGPAGANTPEVTVGWHTWDAPASGTDVFSVDASEGTFSTATGGSDFTPGNAPFGFFSRWANLGDREVYTIDTLNTFAGAIPHNVRVYPLAGSSDAYVIAVDAISGTPEYQDLVFVARNVVPTTVSIAPPGDSSSTDSLVALYRINCGGPLEPTIDDGPDWEADTRYVPVVYLTSDPGGSRAFNSTKTGYAPEVDLTTTNLGIFTYDRWDRGSAGDISYSFPVAAGDYEVRIYLANGVSSLSAPGDRIFSIAIEGSVPSNMLNLDPNADYGFGIGGVESHLLTVSDGSLDVEVQRGPAGNPFINGIEILEAVPSPAARRANPQLAEQGVGAPTLRVYPNPTSRTQKLVVDWELPEEEVVTLRLFDAQGRVVRSLPAAEAATEGRAIVPMQDLPSGVYLLRASGNGWQQTRRILLQD